VVDHHICVAMPSPVATEPEREEAMGTETTNVDAIGSSVFAGNNAVANDLHHRGTHARLNEIEGRLCHLSEQLAKDTGKILVGQAHEGEKTRSLVAAGDKETQNLIRDTELANLRADKARLEGDLREARERREEERRRCCCDPCASTATHRSPLLATVQPSFPVTGINNGLAIAPGAVGTVVATAPVSGPVV
jgi:hypothetical protein